MFVFILVFPINHCCFNANVFKPPPPQKERERKGRELNWNKNCSYFFLTINENREGNWNMRTSYTRKNASLNLGHEYQTKAWSLQPYSLRSIWRLLWGKKMSSTFNNKESINQSVFYDVYNVFYLTILFVKFVINSNFTSKKVWWRDLNKKNSQIRSH